MKIIISPAKKMNVNTDSLPGEQLPEYLEDAKTLCEILRSMSYEEAKALWKCNDKLARLNFERHAHMDLEAAQTPAVLSYEGLQYQYMAPEVFSRDALCYIREHLRILSGLYGVLRPFDRVTPYRLEMQAGLSAEGKKDLYEFWGDKCYRAVRDIDGVIVNLASKEYSRIVEAYLKPEGRFLTIVFGELSNGTIRQKGTLAKMARGEMVRYMAESRIEDPEEIKKFCALEYAFSAEHSVEREWVFLRREASKPSEPQILDLKKM